MRKTFVIFIVIIILTFSGVIVSQNLLKDKKMDQQPNFSKFYRKIAIVIAFRDFRDPEFFIPEGIFKKAGTDITVVSTSLGTAIGADGGEVNVNLLLKNLNPEKFDAIVFIGGPGCLKYLDNEDSYKIIRETVSKGKVLASICISPVILAKSGVLEGKKATVWSSSLDKSPIKILKENGAIYHDEKVVIDGKIITGNGPSAAKEFGENVVNMLVSIP